MDDTKQTNIILDWTLKLYPLIFLVVNAYLTYVQLQWRSELAPLKGDIATLTDQIKSLNENQQKFVSNDVNQLLIQNLQLQISQHTQTLNEQNTRIRELERIK